METSSDFRDLLATSGIPYDVEHLNVLKSTNHPVALYGASDDVADPIVKTLAKHGVQVKMVLYDDDSPVMTDSSPLLKDLEKIHLKDVDKRFKAYHVVIGFVKGYPREREIMGKLKYAYTVGYLSEIFDLETITGDFIFENYHFLKDFFEGFGDLRSKESFIAYMKSKIFQDMKFLPPVFEKVQYFPPGIFELTDHESFFDCGAFVGDTVAGFLKATGGAYKRIWAAEPDRANYTKLVQYVEGEKLTNIETINKGIYDCVGELPFREEGTMLSMLSENSDHHIEVDTIDNITAGKPVTFIKLDVEGAELQALKGAEKTIRKYKPILAVSIYHKKNDLIAIPKYIKEIAPKYKFYFRTHKKLAIDAVLYCVVK